ncbi:glycosyltransferase [Vibrio fluvialis]|nr:glycosyltransferase [Vibrio fluvialis]
MEKKRILVLSPTGTSISGVDRTLEQLVSGLITDHELYVMMPKKAINSALFDDFGANIITYDLPWLIHIDSSDADFVNTLSNRGDIISEIRKTIRKYKIDIVITNTTVILEGAISSIMEGIPHIFHMHALFIDDIYKNLSISFKKSIYNFIVESSTVITASKLLKRDLLSLVEVKNADNIISIENAVELDRFEHNLYNRELKNIVCLGHYNDNKNQLLAVDVAKYVLELDPQIKFNFFGHKEEKYFNEVKKKVSELKLENNVFLNSSMSDVPEYLSSQASILLSTSKTETFPVSFLEAFASGVPVVSTKTAGATNILESFPEQIAQTALELATIVTELLSSEDKYTRLSTDVRKLAENKYSTERYCEEFKDVILRAKVSDLSQKSLTKLLSLSFYGKKVLFITPGNAITSHYLLAQYPGVYLKESIGCNVDIAYGMDIYEKLKNEYDYIYIIRSYHKEMQQLITQYRDNINKSVNVCYVIDDNYFAYDTVKGVHVDGCENEEFASMFSLVDSVIVFSNELYYQAQHYNKNTILAAPAQFHINKDLDLEFQPSGELLIGYMGSLGKGCDFEVVTPAIKAILDEFSNVRLQFIGFIPEELRDHPKVDTMDFNGDYDEFIGKFHTLNWDIALAPLKNTSFNRSKTNNKFREYAAAGYPGIYSDISTYNRSVENLKTGVLVENNADSWYRAIRELVENSSLRSDISRNAKLNISTSFPLSKLVCEYLISTNVSSDKADFYENKQQPIFSFPKKKLINLRSKYVKPGCYSSFYFRPKDRCSSIWLNMHISMLDANSKDIRLGLEVVGNSNIISHEVFLVDTSGSESIELNLKLSNSFSEYDLLEFRFFISEGNAIKVSNFRVSQI